MVFISLPVFFLVVYPLTHRVGSVGTVQNLLEKAHDLKIKFHVVPDDTGRLHLNKN